MAIDKKTKDDKAIKVANFIKDSMGKLKKILITQVFMLTLEASLITVQLGLRLMKMTRLEKLQKIGLNSEDSTKVSIYSDQGLRWIKNTNGLNHQKEMDKFIDNIVSKPRRKIKEFVAFVKDKYFAPEGEEVDNEDFIRRWNGAYEVLNVQD